jgi:PhoH-like ATPase
MNSPDVPSKKPKTFVLDTNVLIHDPEALFTFEGGQVVLPMIVIEELDNFKKENDSRGRNARQVSRYLDELRKHGRLSDGVPLEHGGRLKVEVQARAPLPSTFDNHTKDNRILETALGLSKQGDLVVFITKDINLRIKAEAVGLVAEDYEKEKVPPEKLYLGWRDLELPSEQIDRYFKTRRLATAEIQPLEPLPDHPPVHPNGWKPNEMAILRSHEGGSQSGLARFDVKTKNLVPLTYAHAKPWGLKPLNTEQKFALELLMSPEVELVSLVGVPGSGKTLLALAAGLEQIFEEKRYRRMLIARPVIPVGRDIGYLPGSKEEKLANWMGAIFDNLEFLLDEDEAPGSSKRETSAEDDLGAKVVRSRRTANIYQGESESVSTGSQNVDALFDSGRIVVEAVAFLRGRSLPNQFIVIDDAQNLTPHEMKTVISRVGKGSKIVVTGDPYQIDNPYLDAASTGLSNLVERFKGQSVYGHMTFSKIERSTLAALASELL